MGLNKLFYRVKTGDGRAHSLARRLARRVLTAGIPVRGPGKAFYRGIYSLHVCALEALAILRKFLYAEPLFRARCDKVGVNLRMERIPYIQGHGRIVVGDNVYLSGRSSFTVGGRHYPDPELTIGDDTFIGSACSISVNRRVTIGNHCLLAAAVKISDSDGHPADFLARRAKSPVRKEDIRPVTIEDDAWIGTETIILKGVTIGARSIVGAGSVVTRDVPADSVAAGNPARVIKSLRNTAEN